MYRRAFHRTFSRLKSWTRKIILFLIISFVLLILNFLITKEEYPCFAQDKRNCGREPTEELLVLPEAAPDEDSIIFIEGYGNDYLNPRMWCSIESSASAHPNLRVFVLMIADRVRSTPVMRRILANKPNIHLTHLNVTTLFANSPASEWYRLKKWKSSYWAKSHFSDVLRWAVLWKYGGIYIDMDVLVMKNLRTPFSFFGIESPEWVAAGVIGISKGHSVVEECLRRVNRDFDYTEWGSVGPILLTQVLRDKKNWINYFNEEGPTYEDIIRNPEIKAIHVWNHLSKYQEINLRQKSVYATVASMFCPGVVEELQTIL